MRGQEDLENSKPNMKSFNQDNNLYLKLSKAII